jgi:hypothetical protein
MKSSRAAAHVLLFLCALIVLACTTRTFAQEGFFHAENRNGIWWIIDPRGEATLSLGVDNINYESDRVRGAGACPYCRTLDKIYPDHNAWGLEALARIQDRPYQDFVETVKKVNAAALEIHQRAGKD